MNTIYTYITKLAAAILFSALLFMGCERSIDGLSEPSRTQNPEVFIDGFSAGLEYLPFGDSKLTAFTVDNQTYFGDRGSSMRFDVPNVGDPAGPYAGAIFKDLNGGRDLSSYNALTFYAKATKAATINEIGFGQDFEGNELQANLANLRLSTAWQKYVIPIPDPSRLTATSGMFWYAEGPEDGDGYTFWIDELKYESISTIAQARPFINNGIDQTSTVFNGQVLNVGGLGSIFNVILPLTDDISVAQDITVLASKNYFEFSSSNPSVAALNEDGAVEVVGPGTTTVTATLGGTPARGELQLESLGAFSPAPVPTRDPENVISIFSDAYTNVPVDFYNGFYAPFQTTTSNDFTVNGDNVLGYENFNFVGIEFNQNVPTIDGSNMTGLSVDIFIPEAVPPGSAFRVNLRDFGPSGTFGGADDTVVSRNLPRSAIPSGQWVTIELNISNMAGKANLGQIVFDADLGIALRGATIYVDNIYLFRD
jgi:hypothetical protein